MSTEHRIYWLHALSSLHVGAGRGEGFIDLPLAREKVTDFPYVPGSSVKGVFADAKGASLPDARAAQTPDGKLLKAAFGTADQTSDTVAGANAGALVFTDARLVCLPVASLFGTFAWCTSRFVLRRLARDLVPGGFVPPPTPPTQGDRVVVPQGLPPSAIVHEKAVYLRELKCDTTECGATAVWADQLGRWLFPNDTEWQKIFRERFAVLPDNIFNALTRHGTEVQPHVRIDSELKRVADGALWYEESLPAETILAGLVWCDRVYGVHGVTAAQVIGLCPKEPVVTQVGGKATVGKGVVRQVFTAPTPTTGGRP